MKNKLILILYTLLLLPLRFWAQPVLDIGDVSIACSANEVVVPIQVSNFTNIESFQFTLHWDISQYTFVSTSGVTFPFSPANGGFTGIDSVNYSGQGNMTFFWLKVGGMTLPGTDTVMYVKFTVSNPSSLNDLTFTDVPSETKFFDPTGTSIAFVRLPGVVSINDNVPPGISCPGNVSYQALAPSPISGLAPVSITDNCNVQSVTWTAPGATPASGSDDASGSVFPFGQTTVTYVATDEAGNTGSCAFVVELINATPPVDTFTLSMEGGPVSCGGSYYLDVIADNFDDLSSFQFSMAWDPAVLVFDSVGMFAGSPLNISSGGNFGYLFSSLGNVSFAWITFGPVGISMPDNTKLFRIYFSVAGGVGSNASVDFTNFPSNILAFDGGNNQVPVNTFGAAAVVTDNVPPSFTCPASVTVTAPVGQSSATVTGIGPVNLTDNCSSVTLGYTLSGATTGNGQNTASGLQFNAGVTTVVYTATDGANNTSSCSFSVTVLTDNTGAVQIELDSVEAGCLSTQAVVPVLVNNFTDVAGMSFNIIWDPTVLHFDSVGSYYPNLALNPLNFGNFQFVNSGQLQFFAANFGWPDIPDGSTFYALYFTILDYNASSDVQFVDLPGVPIEAIDLTAGLLPLTTENGNVTVVDNQPPTIANCPPDVTIYAPANECSADVFYTPPSATDSCSGVASFVTNHNPGNFTGGTTTVVWEATDHAGNVTTCQFNITVVESIPPDIFNCPANITVNAPSGACSATATWTAPFAFDGCCSCNVPIVSTMNPGSTFAVGVTTVTYTATDLSGNTTTCAFTVTVKETQAPELVCPTDLSFNALAGSCAAIANWTIPTPTDNCPGNISLTASSSPGLYLVGNHVITYTATDISGNTASCSFNVTINDVEAPVLSNCPNDITVAADVFATVCGANVQWDPVTAVDVCDQANTTITSSMASGSFFTVGTTTVVYETTDGSGNTASCSFTVTVTDNQAPAVTNCPSNMLIKLPSDKCDTTLTWTGPTFTDLCGIANIDTTIHSGTSFTVGVYTVTYTATDNYGNESVCSFTIDVRDQTKPVFDNCPGDITIDAAGACAVTAAWDALTAHDNCDANVEIIPNLTTATFTNSYNELMFIAFDNSGNSDTCTMVVYVTGLANPVVSNCPGNITVNDCTGTASWASPQFSGFCDAVTVDSTHASGTQFPIGSTVVTYTATDGNNTQQCSFTVTVVDDVAPVVQCPVGPLISAAGVELSDPSNFISSVVGNNDCATAQISFVIPNALDLCTGTIAGVQTSGPASGSTFGVGQTSVVFTYTDQSGNTATCPVNIEVVAFGNLAIDTDSISACVGDEVQLSVTSIPGATYTWYGPDGTVIPNETGNSIDITVTSANAGSYTTQAALGNCESNVSDTIRILLPSKPVANDDGGITALLGESIDSINVLGNDIWTSDYVLNYCSPVNGITLEEGNYFSFNGSTVSTDIVFEYCLCSKQCNSVCDTATVTIKVKNSVCSFIPNIITPNDDNLNDWLDIPCLEFEEHAENSLIIFNQWGDKVFEASPYDPYNVYGENNRWKGTLNGDDSKPLPDGVYYYIFKPSALETPSKGFIELFR